MWLQQRMVPELHEHDRLDEQSGGNDERDLVPAQSRDSRRRVADVITVASSRLVSSQERQVILDLTRSAVVHGFTGSPLTALRT